MSEPNQRRPQAFPRRTEQHSGAPGARQSPAEAPEDLVAQRETAPEAHPDEGAGEDGELKRQGGGRQPQRPRHGRHHRTDARRRRGRL